LGAIDGAGRAESFRIFRRKSLSEMMEKWVFICTNRRRASSDSQIPACPPWEKSPTGTDLEGSIDRLSCPDAKTFAARPADISLSVLDFHGRPSWLRRR
jgi:hypothetical protein